MRPTTTPTHPDRAAERVDDEEGSMGGSMRGPPPGAAAAAPGNCCCRAAPARSSSTLPFVAAAATHHRLRIKPGGRMSAAARRAGRTIESPTAGSTRAAAPRSGNAASAAPAASNAPEGTRPGPPIAGAPLEEKGAGHTVFERVKRGAPARSSRSAECGRSVETPHTRRKGNNIRARSGRISQTWWGRDEKVAAQDKAKEVGKRINTKR